MITLDTSTNCVRAFSARRLVLGRFRLHDQILNLSLFHSTPPPKRAAELKWPIEKEYRELLALRERVEKAEAATKRPVIPVKSENCTRSVARIVSRRPITRRSVEFTKCQLYAMLADAVRNTR
jgi:hypothetical protein